MSEKLDSQLQAMLEKYTELLIGETTPEAKQDVLNWILYNHIAKSMPPLAKHWNHLYPEGKEEMKTVVESIQKKNKALRDTKE